MTVVACIIGPSSSIVAALRSAASRPAGFEGKREEGASTNRDRSNTTQQSDGRPEAGRKRWARRLRDAEAAATAAGAAGTGMPAPATNPSEDGMREGQECGCVCESVWLGSQWWGEADAFACLVCPSLGQGEEGGKHATA
jgi:hypothetical protein